MTGPRLTRRETLKAVALGAASLSSPGTLLGVESDREPGAESHQATGIRIGEVTADSAIIWTRLTANPARVRSGRLTFETNKQGDIYKPETAADISRLDGACPGMAGQVRVRFGTAEDLAEAQATEWASVDGSTDFIHQFRLTGLKPATRYFLAVETAGPTAEPPHAPLRGMLQTAPTADAAAAVTFSVITCEMVADMDREDVEDGFRIFDALARLQPDFHCMTGDNVYYDGEPPFANTPELARYHWDRMYSYPRHVEFYRQTAAYFQKDDHDVLDNDCHPGRTLGRHGGTLTFETGQRIFREEVPLGAAIYRTFRWGKLLQIWLTDGRDFRSRNSMRDGPDKTILGREQKEWLKRTLAESDATWKVLVSPTPIVGPDRARKNDNHANAGFQHEGDELRHWFREHVPHNFFVVCGDRHWQYHSVHPETGLREFACGPVSNRHAAGTPGEDAAYHRFHRVAGGFLTVSVREEDGRGVIAFRHHDVHGDVVHEYEQRAEA